MDSSRAEEKRRLDEDEEDEEEEDYDDEADKRMRMTQSPADKKRSAAMGAGSGPSSGWGSTSCQADNCSVNMVEEKKYHRRHKVCQHHAKATAAVVAGIQQRFCQQCSRFHELAEFDQAKRSCRRRLAGHNERRRKSSYDLPGESSS